MFAELEVCQYQNLLRLKIDMDNSLAPSNPVSMDPVTMAPSLIKLELCNVDLPPSFWETLSTHPHIRNLGLSDMCLKKDDTSGFWKTCMKLESLEIGGVYFKDGDGFPRNAVFDQMRSLNMRGTALYHLPYQLHLIHQSPMLESLDWEIDTLREIEERIIDSCWPQLKKLRIRGPFITDDELAFILNAVGKGHGGVEDLVLHDCDLETRVFGALGVHFSTLVKVDITCANLSERSTPSDFLCFCPRLEILRPLNVFAKEIAERGPWVCQRLRELEIKLCFQESEQDLHQLVYERLSTLIQLERLTISHFSAHRGGSSEGLRFRIDCGLGRLASLQQLTYICIYTTQKCWPGMEEAVWMVENLKKLGMIAGFFNSDQEVKAQLVPGTGASGMPIVAAYFYRDAGGSAVGTEGFEWMVDNWKKLKRIKGCLNSDKE
ncbi:hypothetical protein BGX34_009424, partial [Mortierella sp. NVP85]